MKFSVASPGTVLPPPTSRPRVPVTLPPVTRTMMCPSRSGRSECWAAETTDKVWGFTREEDTGTTWTVSHLPTRTIVDFCLGSLKQCRLYVGSGQAREDLERIQAGGGSSD